MPFTLLNVNIWFVKLYDLECCHVSVFVFCRSYTEDIMTYISVYVHYMYIYISLSDFVEIEIYR